METIGAFEAKTHWSSLLNKVTSLGQEITITKHGKPVAKLVPYHSQDSINAAIRKLREMRKKTTLGGLSWKELRDAGRK